MPAILDLPISASTGIAHRRPEIVANTPYIKAKDDTRQQYGFEGGFYYILNEQITHPVVERQRQEMARRIQQLFDQFNQIAGSLQEISPAWQDPTPIAPVIGKLFAQLINNPFERVVLEQTPDESLLIKTDWQQHNVYIDVYFDAEIKDGYEIVLSAYKAQQREPVLSVAGPLNFVFDRLFSLSVPADQAFLTHFK